MELHTKYGFGVVHNSCKRRSWRPPDYVKRRRLVCDLVAVGHPHLERRPKVGEQAVRERVGICAWRCNYFDFCKAILAMRVGLNFAAKCLSNFLDRCVRASIWLFGSNVRTWSP
jgi:hypothetical protein